MKRTGCSRFSLLASRFSLLSASLPFLLSCSKIWGTAFLDDPEVRTEGGAPAAGGSGGVAQGGSGVGGVGGVEPSGGSAGSGGAGGDLLCAPGETEPCYSGDAATDGIGVCHGGLRACDSSGMSWGTCVGEVAPTDENCATAADEDCDGLTSTDTDSGCECAPGAEQECASEFPGGTPCTPHRTCASDGKGWGDCIDGSVPDPEGDLCGSGLGNGIDDDCNGLTDDGCDCALGQTKSCYLGPSGTLGKGLCHAGTQTCNASTGGTEWSGCEGQGLPMEELCDAGQQDEDCDGSKNEPDADCVCIPGQPGPPCYTGPANSDAFGPCGPGTLVCADDGKSFLEDECTGEITPLAQDMCGNGVDDDNCDGTVGEKGIWVLETVEDGGAADLGKGSSIDVDAAGGVWVSYKRGSGSNGDILVAHKAAGATSWGLADVALNNVAASASTALAVDKSNSESKGNVWVAFVDDTNNLKTKYRTATDDTWTPGPGMNGVVDTSVYVVRPSLRVDHLQTVWLSYRWVQANPVDEYVRVATKGPNSSTWNSENVNLGSSLDGYFTSLTVRAGKVWLGYDEGNALIVMEHLSLNSWSVPVSIPNGGDYASVGLSMSGTTLWASHYDEANTDLRVGALTGPPDARVDGSGNESGAHSALAVDGNNTVWVSYYRDGNKDNLMVARKRVGESWDLQDVDTGADDVGLYTSIGVDPTDNEIWVSYWDATNNALKVAHTCE